MAEQKAFEISSKIKYKKMVTKTGFGKKLLLTPTKNGVRKVIAVARLAAHRTVAGFLVTTKNILGTTGVSAHHLRSVGELFL